MAVNHPFWILNKATGRYDECAVYDVETRERLLRFPIDAREMVASGRYSWAPLEPARDTAAGEPLTTVPAGDAEGEDVSLDAAPRKRGRPRKAQES